MRITSRVRSRIRSEIERRRRYEPSRYWEYRAPDFVEGNDDPTSWASRGWLTQGRELEHDVVPRLIRDHEITSVLVAGAGSGVQYAYLQPIGLEIRGFDLAPTLVETCRARFPTIPTAIGDVITADETQKRADAVLASGVLQHIRPVDIERAVAALKRLAERLVIQRDMVRLDASSKYQFVHDYDALFSGWTPVYRETADETSVFRTELIAWLRP
jgi:hypothetical protein